MDLCATEAPISSESFIYKVSADQAMELVRNLDEVNRDTRWYTEAHENEFNAATRAFYFEHCLQPATVASANEEIVVNTEKLRIKYVLSRKPMLWLGESQGKLIRSKKFLVLATLSPQTGTSKHTTAAVALASPKKRPATIALARSEKKPVQKSKPTEDDFITVLSQEDPALDVTSSTPSNQTIENFSIPDLRGCVARHLPVCWEIFKGKAASARHAIYKLGGKARSNLKHKVRFGKFREDQQEAILEVLLEEFCKKGPKYLQVFIFSDLCVNN